MSVETAGRDQAAFLRAAMEAAREAGEILRQGFQRPKSVRFKGEIDLVTESDLASEQAIKNRLTSAFPHHAILAEESGAVRQDSPWCWIVDPLDGTTNFAHGFPMFAVSIGLEYQGPDGPVLEAGVVFDPLRDEMFTAARGGGAFLNDEPIRVTEEGRLERALLATGFPYYIHERPEGVLDRFGRMIRLAQGVRRPGAAALDLAWLAAGRVDGFWEENLQPWDTAAGALLVLEAGGMVTDFGGRPFRPAFKEILATNGRLHYNMEQVLNQHGAGRQIEPASPREER